MKIPRSLLSAWAAAIALAANPASGAYPEKALRIMVPFPAGGASDAAARAIGQHLAKSLAQPVVVENRPGASGAVAAQAVIASAPDGYTLLWASASMVALPLLLRSSPYASMGEMAPVGTVGRLPFCMYLNPDIPARTVAELREHAKSRPVALNYATGSLSEFMAAVQFERETGLRIERVPYKGGAQLMPDLIAGRVQLNFGPASTGLPYVKSGRLRALATLLPERTPILPDVPTAAEAGIPGVSVPTWQAVLVPGNTPREIVERLSRAIDEALRDAGTRAQLLRIGVQPEGSTPDALAARIRDDFPLWSRFVLENGIEKE